MYEKRLSRAFPGLIVLLLDDSASMGDAMPGTSDPKYQWVIRLLGHILHELLARSTEIRNDKVVVKPRCCVHAIAYGGTPTVLGPGLMDIQTAVELFGKSGNSLGLSGNRSGTDSAAAFELVLDTLSPLVADDRFRQSFPPMVFHLTDGESQTDAAPIAETIKRLSTADGNALVVNAYIGTQTTLEYEGAEDFPGYLMADEAGPSAYNLRLFEMSSVMPATIRENLVGDGIFPKIRTGARLLFDVRTKDMLKHAIQVVGSVGSRPANSAAA